MLPNAVLRKSDLSARAKLAYAVLKSYDFHGEGCHVARETIAEAMGCSTDTVDRAIGELLKAGLIEKRRRGLTQSNEYLLLTPEAAPVRSPESAPMRSQESAPVRPEVELLKNNRPITTTATKAISEEDQRAAEIRDAFNEQAGTRYRLADWRSMIVRRIRSHPDYSIEDWRRVIRNGFAEAWWKRKPSWNAGKGVVTPGAIFKSDRMVATYENRRRLERRYTALSEWDEDDADLRA
jgi:Helix-turn-helix domain